MIPSSAKQLFFKITYLTSTYCISTLGCAENKYHMSSDIWGSQLLCCYHITLIIMFSLEGLVIFQVGQV